MQLKEQPIGDGSNATGGSQLVAEVEGRGHRTLLDVLDDRARRYPDRVAYTFLRDGEVESDRLTFGALRQRAVAVAARLTSLNAPGDRAILLYPQGLEFVVAFFGCLYAGVIAVPASIPNRKRGLEILRGVAADAGAKWLLSTESLLEQLTEDIAADGALAGLSRLDPEQRLGPASDSWVPPKIEPSALALLQYTSGSTGSPRGVAVTHANIVDNHEQLEQNFEHDENAIIVSWLPMFHDMGLATVVMTVWSGGHCILMAPGAFVQNPRRWLEVISNHRATTSLAPDFAYDLCIRRIGIKERAGLDLSSWRIAGNGSEPVRASTIDRFVEAFAASGFRREAVHPGYGLAEATLFVTGVPCGQAPVVRLFSADGLRRGQAEPVDLPARGHWLVSCGRPWLGTRLAIVNPETREEAGPGQVGEIWVSGASVAAGYWGKELMSDQVFRATTAAGKGPFLRTGDLGFINDGHLFVTGRHKDLIIIRGRNYYPQDIEVGVSACHPALVPNGCAAFSVDSEQGEQLVIVQEVLRASLRTLDSSAIFRAIRAVVSDHHALHTHAIVLLKPTGLPRTTSGKLRRKDCRQAFLDQTLPSVASWVAPSSPKDLERDPDAERREASSQADRLIDWLRRHAADLINAYANDDRRVVPTPLLRDLAKQGLIGMQVEVQFGGLGLGHFDTARVLDQLAAFDFALALFVGLNNHLGIQPVAKYAGPSIKAVLLPGLAHGQERAAFAFEEPGRGAPTNGLSVKAKPDGEERWRLFGTKYLDGAVQGASVINVFAYHEEPPGISAFVVSEGVEGLRQVRDGLSMGVLGFTRDTIVLDGVRVGRENLLGGLGSGMDIAREAMMHTRLSIGAACIGGMKRCAQVVSHDGPFFGTINGKFTPNPVTLARLGSITARVTALECLVHRVARAIDSGHDVPSEAFVACKILGPELLLRSIDDLMQLGVSGGYAETNRISSLYRDAGLLRNFDGPPESVAELTGAAIIEGDASLRLLIEEVFHAPEVVRWIGPVVETVRQRMSSLNGALARRAERWGHTRVGELATWLVLLAAVEGVRRDNPNAELERARAWAEAQFEQALSSVRFGTPSETATLDTSDVAAAFAAYASPIVPHSPELSIRDPVLGLESWEEPRSHPGVQGGATRSAEYASEASKRELRSWVVSWLARRLQIPVSQVESGRSFADHGLDSVAAVELAKALSDKLGRELDATLLWNFATIDALVDHLVRSHEPVEAKPSAKADTATPRRSPSEAVESQLDDEIARLEQELRSRK